MLCWITIADMFKTFVFVGPSAVGKSYIAEQLRLRYPHLFAQPKLYTTRAPRGGEESSDRIFVNTDNFASMVDQGSFVVHGDFGGNRYGYTADSVYPTDRHLLINTWPALIPQFCTLSQGVIIGMHPPRDWEPLLTARMHARGDTSDTIIRRLDAIRQDIDDLNTHTALVEGQGKMFMIEDDTTVHDILIPWVLREMSTATSV